jgi:hypothetical protein
MCILFVLLNLVDVNNVQLVDINEKTTLIDQLQQ